MFVSEECQELHALPTSGCGCFGTGVERSEREVPHLPTLDFAENFCVASFEPELPRLANFAQCSDCIRQVLSIRLHVVDIVAE